MGCAVIPFDRGVGDSLLTPDNFYDIRTFNCSGRYESVKYSVEALTEQIAKYDVTIGYEMRLIMCEENDHFKVAQQYLDLAGW